MYSTVIATSNIRAASHFEATINFNLDQEVELLSGQGTLTSADVSRQFLAKSGSDITPRAERFWKRILNIILHPLLAAFMMLRSGESGGHSKS